MDQFELFWIVLQDAPTVLTIPDCFQIFLNARCSCSAHTRRQGPMSSEKREQPGALSSDRGAIFIGSKIRRCSNMTIEVARRYLGLFPRGCSASPTPATSATPQHHRLQTCHQLCLLYSHDIERQCMCEQHSDVTSYLTSHNMHHTIRSIADNGQVD